MKLDKKTISQFYKQYSEILDEVVRLEQEQREQGANLIEWINKYKERATRIYANFKKNEEEVSRILSPILTEKVSLDEKTAEYFLDEIVELRKAYYGDSLVTYEVLKVIVKYYENHPPKLLDNYVIALGLMGAYEDVFETDEHLASAVEYDTKTVAYSKHYLEFTKPEAQRRMFYAFYNRILSENKRKDFSCERLFCYTKEATDFYNNPLYRQVEGYPYESYQKFAQVRCNLAALSFSKSDVNCPVGLFNQACASSLRSYEKLRRQGRKNDEMELLTYLNYVIAAYRSDLMDGKEAFERLYERYLTVERSVDYNDIRYHDAPVFEIVNGYAPELIVLVEWSGYPQEEIQRIKKSIASEVLHFFASIPPGRRNDVTNNFMLEAFRYILPYYDVASEGIEEILEAIITRESTTAIHINMVKTIASEVVKALVRNKPELLVGTNGYTSLEEVREHMREILEYTRIAAFCHDLGKLAIADIINIQYREITKTEFAIIKRHPDIGAEVLRKIPYLRTFEDIARGHQKSYDGKGGYPETFDNRKSPNAIWIDIISMCDCIDAATDSLGRIYKKAKTFDEVLMELIEGAGTRFNPDLVTLIQEDTALQEMLRYITKDGRDSYLYAVYRHMDK